MSESKYNRTIEEFAKHASLCKSKNCLTCDFSDIDFKCYEPSKPPMDIGHKFVCDKWRDYK